MSILKLLSQIIKPIIIVALLVSLCNCSAPNPEESLQHITGYWEIEKVILQDGSEKQYNYNQSIDFFELKDTTGTRRKMQPKLDGHFTTSKDQIRFSYKIENNSLRLYFKSAIDTWKETVVLAKENQMIIKNEAGNLYFYKRYQKLDL